MSTQTETVKRPILTGSYSVTDHVWPQPPAPPVQPGGSTSEALYAEAKEISRKRDALRAAIETFTRQIAELDARLAEMRVDIKIAIEREDAP